MIHHSTAVMVGHGESTASTGAKKKPAPIYHAEPARSDVSTKRSHRGIGDSVGRPSHMIMRNAHRLWLRREEPGPGKPSRLPSTGSQTQHRQPIRRLRGRLRLRTRRTDLLDAV